MKIILTILLLCLSCKPEYKFDSKQAKDYQSFDDFYKEKLALSQEKKTRPGCDEKLTRYSKGKTKYAILYIHGFGACRKEGEFVTDKISEKFKYNIYYVRLPGHGTTKEEQRDTEFASYLQEAQTSLDQATKLGEKLIIIGTSMGGLIATHLAAENPEKVHGLILASPFYEFGNKSAKVLEYPGGLYLAYAVSMGTLRESGRGRATNKSIYDPNYDKYWYIQQYISALHHLIDLKDFIVSEETFKKIKVPVLLLYFQNEKEEDTAAKVSAMVDAFSVMGTNPKSKKVKIEQGNHILLSEYIKSDFDLAEKSMQEFITELQ
jgi:pimeloyl-ACP methyl ester carboxylesterase